MQNCDNFLLSHQKTYQQYCQHNHLMLQHGQYFYGQKLFALLQLDFVHNTNFVLNKFNSEEKIILNNIIDVVSRSVVYLFSDKKDCFINMCNKYMNIKY